MAGLARASIWRLRADAFLINVTMKNTVELSSFNTQQEIPLT